MQPVFQATTKGLNNSPVLAFLAARVPSLESILGWVVLAAWIETEGCINSTINRSRRRRDGSPSPSVSRRICIIQKDRRPLDVLSIFLANKGITNSVRLMKPSSTSFRRTPYFRLNITGLHSLDEIIRRCTPYFITQKARYQVEKYWRYRHSTAEELRKELAHR
jgi:hypothetical protein